MSAQVKQVSHLQMNAHCGVRSTQLPKIFEAPKQLSAVL